MGRALGSSREGAHLAGLFPHQHINRTTRRHNASVHELPSVAIVIPNWNGAAHLPACLDAVGELDYPADLLEIVVVDNGSTDESRSIVAHNYPNVRLLSLPRNQGFAAACNAGAREARSECIAFMNNDMRAEPMWLRHLVDAYDPEKDYICVGGVILNWDGSQLDFVEGTVNFHGFAWQEHFGEPVKEDLINDGGDLLFACGGSMLISREVYLDLGGFDSAYFAYYEDVDLGWRLWLAGHKVRLAGRSRILHRHHGTGGAFPTHVRSLLYERNALYTLVKNLSDENLSRVLAPALLLLVQKAIIMSGRADEAFDVGAPEVTETSKVASAGLVPLYAVFNLLDDLPQLLERRRQVQDHRQRRDEEVFELLFRPFKPWMHDERYLETSILLRETFGLDRFFLHQRATRVLVVGEDGDRQPGLVDEISTHAQAVIVFSGEQGETLAELLAESDLVIVPATTRHAQMIGTQTKGLLVVDVGDGESRVDSRLLARADVVLGSSPQSTPIESLPAIVREPWRWRRNSNGLEKITLPEDAQRLLRLKRERKTQPDLSERSRRGVSWRNVLRGVRRTVGRVLRRSRLTAGSRSRGW